MMRSLYSGVAGLKTHQTKMDVIGNNIANVNTTSYKSQSITFSDLMYQTTQTASGATETKGGVNARQIGLGAKSGAINTAITSQGATQTTNNPFDIMITGEAFFIVNNGAENLYTRDGSFYVDGAGNLAMQSNGYLVQGWVAQEDKDTGEITINKNGGLSSLQIMSAANSTYSPASTTAALFSGNIDDNDTNLISDDGKTITLEFYDNKGYLYTGKFTLKDTGVDHQFALTLTDIIDSDGYSINKTLSDGSKVLDHVTFGDVNNTTTRTTTIDKGSKYTIVVDSTGENVAINAQGGDVKYQSVPTDGYVSDLKSTSSKSYAGILNTVYGVDVSDESTYAADARYTIDDSGNLTISYTATDLALANGEYYTNKYTFSTNSSDKYFMDPTTLEAYHVPSGTKNTAATAFADTDYLSTVFGIADTYATSEYVYTYDSSTLTMDIMKAVSVSSASSTSPGAYSAIESVAQYFTTDGTTAGEDVATAAQAWVDAAADGETRTLDQVYYTYNSTDDVMTLMAAVYVDDDKTDAVSGITEDDYNEFKTEVASLLPDTGDTLTKAEVESIMNTYSSDTSSATYRVAAALNGMMDTHGLDEVTLDDTVTVSGTDGLVVKYTVQVLQNPTALTDSDGNIIKYYHRAEATGTLNTTKFTDEQPIQPKAVYAANSSTYAKSYAITSYSATLTSGYGIYQSLIDNVFSTNPDIPDLSSGKEYTIAFSTNTDTAGYMQITHSETETAKPLASGYSVSKNSDGTLNYTSETAYEEVPIKGNISDLLTYATGDNAGLLNKVYGVDDETADAYGLDGTYEINTSTGAITLTVGQHSVQLQFNAANGALTSADGDKSGMVVMNFNQSTVGLEAFGFQSTSDADAHNPGDIQIDFSTITNYNTNGSSTIKAVKGDSKSLNTGRAVGEMNGVSISTDGQIYATYSNGQTKLLGQIASAEFANASGLSKEGDNLYASTLNSGEATVQDITTDGGYMNTGVLEMSNVDLSSEFTEMITTQRGFQANSRIITVSDTLLEELTNLKR